MGVVRIHFGNRFTNDCLHSPNRFCKASKIDEPSTAIKTCKAAIFKAYLFWRVKNSRIKKESSIITCWKVLSMVYARLAERYMDEGILYDIRNVYVYLYLFQSVDCTNLTIVDPAELDY